MRRRLLLVLLPLLTALLVALEVPLAQTYADGVTQDLAAERLGDAAALVAPAQRVLLDGTGRRTLAAAIAYYTDSLPDATVTVFENDASVRSSRPRRASRRALQAADALLAEGEVSDPETAWPWRKTTMVVGTKIGSGVPIGAVVVEAPTTSAREQVTRRIAVLAAGGLAVLLLTSALCALPLAHWMLRPVYDLNSAAGRLAAGDLTARASERGGPPELRGLARAFNQMADYLVATLQRQRAFVADASHELRNPLATLRLRLDALAGKVDNSAARDLRLALGESDRLAHTVQRLLELARAEATAAEQLDVDVVALTAQRLEAWRPSFDAAGSVVRFNAPTHAGARCAPEALEYALDVLLDNACTFAPGARVDVSIVAAGGGVEIIVRDHGPGLSDAELAHAGERFWRSPQHRTLAGTGIGLATARALLEGSQGSMAIGAADPGLEIRLRLAASTGVLRDTSAERQDEASAGTSESPSPG